MKGLPWGSETLRGEWTPPDHWWFRGRSNVLQSGVDSLSARRTKITMVTGKTKGFRTYLELETSFWFTSETDWEGVGFILSLKAQTDTER